MCRTSIYLIYLATFAIIAWTVKGARISFGPPFNGHGVAVAEKATSTHGLCNKTIVYRKSYKSNASDGSSDNTTQPQPENVTTFYTKTKQITILECCKGYQRNLTTGECKPQCRQSCLGGECTRPNVCTCKFGYKKDWLRNQCRPVCLRGCENGECVAPRICRCNIGYVLINGHECVPVCEGGCPHGVCTAPGICTCNDGYVNPTGERESCVSDCPDGCSGGECISPGICNCTTGYTRDQEGRCRPSTLESLSGLSCQSGWRLEEGMCVPICSRPCQKDAYCSVPEVCVCKFGYEEVGGFCQPSCPDGCKNGNCIAPRVCACRPGYVLNDNHECVALCNDGQLTAPGICTCYDEYVNPPWERGACVPYCASGCIGGECISPGLCKY